MIGRVGRGIVLALRDQATASNELFKENKNQWLWLRDSSGAKTEKRRVDLELQKVGQNPSFIFWLTLAVSYNRKNGVPDSEVPPALLRLLELKGK